MITGGGVRMGATGGLNIEEGSGQWNEEGTRYRRPNFTDIDLEIENGNGHGSGSVERP